VGGSSRPLFSSNRGEFTEAKDKAKYKTKEERQEKTRQPQDKIRHETITRQDKARKVKTITRQGKHKRRQADDTFFGKQLLFLM
jgi:hypothetical protein